MLHLHLGYIVLSKNLDEIVFVMQPHVVVEHFLEGLFQQNPLARQWRECLKGEDQPRTELFGFRMLILLTSLALVSR